MAEAKFTQNLLAASEDINLQKLAQATFTLDQSKINAWYNNIESKFRLIEEEYDFTNKEKKDLCMIVLSKSQDPISIPIATYKIDLQKQNSGKRPRTNTEICNIGNDESPLTVHRAHIQLECIFYSKEKPEAIVDGKIVHEGDTIKGYKILRIHEDSIELENDGNIFRQHISDIQESEYTIKKETDYEYRNSAPLKGISESSSEIRKKNVNTIENSSEESDLTKYKSIEFFVEDISLREKKENLYETSTNIGGYKYYNATCSNGDYITGTSNRIGKFEFHNFLRSDGTSISGTSTNIGNFDFSQFSLSDGTNINGTTTGIGNFDFHNFVTSDGRSINGTSNRIGNLVFHQFNDSIGNSTGGTTIEFEKTHYTNLDW